MAVRVIFSLVLISALSIGTSASAQPLLDQMTETPYLLDSPLRHELKDQGYTIEMLAVNDTWGNTRGGRDRGAGTLGNLFTLFEVDTEKAGLWENGKFHVWGIYVYGRRPSRAVGDYQFTSSIDSFETYELFEAYYEHSFIDDRVQIRAGVKDFTLEFAILNYGFTLVNSSFVTPATITQVPNSFYPSTGLGIEGIGHLSEDVYTMVGIFDGKTSDNLPARSRDYGLSSNDGAYFISEVGFKTEETSRRYAKVALGGWYNTRDFIDLDNAQHSDNYGSYLIGETLLWREHESSTEGLGIFGQLGQAAQDRNFNSWYVGSGLHYQGLFPQRDKDSMMLGYNLAHISNDYRESHPGIKSSEQVYELAYRATILPYLTLTPDVQYVHNPSGRTDIGDALIVYLRSEVLL